MVKNVTYQNRIRQEENTPLVTILETRIDKKQSTAIDSRQTPYVIDLAKASFGGVHYPVPGSQWYLKKISGVWTLMARAAQQNPELDPSITPVPGDTVMGSEGTTYIVNGSSDISFDTIYPIDSIYLSLSASFDPNVTFAPTVWSQLQDKFLVGAGGSYAVAATGGATTHTLVEANLPSHAHAVGTLANAAESSHTHAVGTYANAAESSHTHSVSITSGDNSVTHTHTGPSHTHDGGTLTTNSQGAHTHTIEADFDGGSGSTRYTVHRGGGAGTHDSDASTSNGAHTHSSFTGATGSDGTGATGNNSAAHTHSVSGTSAAGSSHNHVISGSSAAGASHNHTISGSTDSTGSGTAINHLPPYLAVYMWRRTS